MRTTQQRIPLALLIFALVTSILGPVLIVLSLSGFLIPHRVQGDFQIVGNTSALIFSLVFTISGLGAFVRINWTRYLVPTYLAILTIVGVFTLLLQDWFSWILLLLLTIYSTSYLLNNSLVERYFKSRKTKNRTI